MVKGPAVGGRSRYSEEAPEGREGERNAEEAEAEATARLGVQRLPRAHAEGTAVVIFKVRLPLTGVVEVSVEASGSKEAKTKALEIGRALPTSP